MKPQLKALWRFNPEYTEMFQDDGNRADFILYAIERAHEFGYDLTIEVGLQDMYVVESHNDEDKYDLQDALEKIYEDWLETL